MPSSSPQATPVCLTGHTARNTTSSPDWRRVAGSAFLWASRGRRLTDQSGCERLCDRFALVRIRQPSAATGEVVFQMRQLAGRGNDAGDRGMRGDELECELAPARGV